jgi:hypothetical protein
MDWSASRLKQAAEQGRVAINPLIYADVSIACDTIEELDEALLGIYPSFSSYQFIRRVMYITHASTRKRPIDPASSA